MTNFERQRGEFTKNGLWLQKLLICTCYLPSLNIQFTKDIALMNANTPIKFGAEFNSLLFCIWLQLLTTVYSQLLVSQSSSVGWDEAEVQYQF